MIRPAADAVGVATCSLGYWLVDVTVWRGMDRDRVYRGLDRQPLMPVPDMDRGYIAVDVGGLLGARNRCWRLEDAGLLRRNAAVALKMRDDFAALGMPLDVVRADLAELPDMRLVPSDLAARFDKGLAAWTVDRLHESVAVTPLGFDVTYPFPSFHSAIRQPVLDSYAPRLLGELNEHGLYPTLASARTAVDVCNATDTAWPFCAVAIFVIGV